MSKLQIDTGAAALRAVARAAVSCRRRPIASAPLPLQTDDALPSPVRVDTARLGRAPASPGPASSECVADARRLAPPPRRRSTAPLEASPSGRRRWAGCRLRPARSGSPPPSRRARWRGRCGNRSRSGRYWCRRIWAGALELFADHAQQQGLRRRGVRSHRLAVDAEGRPLLLTQLSQLGEKSQ
jgi:hypothetical protein